MNYSNQDFLKFMEHWFDTFSIWAPNDWVTLCVFKTMRVIHSFKTEQKK